MLQIKVSDQIFLEDDLDKTIEFVVNTIKKWHAENDKNPLQLVIENQQNKAPPAIEINVSENIKTNAVFG